MAKGLFVLNVASSLNAAPPPNAAVNAVSPQAEAFGAASSPTFSHVLFARNDANRETISNRSTAVHPQRVETKEDEQPEKIRHSKTDSAPKASSVLNASVPSTPPPSSAGMPPVTNTATPSASVTSSMEMSRVVELAGSNQSTAATAVNQMPNALSTRKQPANISGVMQTSGSNNDSSASVAIGESGRELGCQILDANGDPSAPAKDRPDVDVAQTCDEAPSTATDALRPTTRSASQQQSDTTSSPANMQGNRAAQDAQITTAPTAGVTQVGNIQALPAAATLIPIVADGNVTPSPKLDSQARASIDHGVEPALPAIGGTAAANGAQAIQASVAANGDPTAGTSDSGGSFSRSGDHSTAQTQSSRSSHSTDDAKSSNASDSSQSSQTQADNQAAGPQIPGRVSTSSAASVAAVATQSAHIAAHAAAAQTNAPGDSSVGARSLGSAAAAAGQSDSIAPSVATNLPHSLNDVNQASQLYQRLGNAEMHISMDTDALGSIDLRAVVHQGSLSATIAVQRTDVQALLVNELPALQHSLAEKNFQVNQISVLAGSIGGEANPDPQQHDRQNRGQSMPAATSAFGDDPSATLLSRAHASQIVALTGHSARLSVIA